MKKFVLFTILCLSAGAVWCQQKNMQYPDSTGQVQFYVQPASQKSNTEYADSIIVLRKTPNWLKEYLSSLMQGHIDRTREKRVDVSFVVTPSYSREGGLGFGAGVTGLYRCDMNDTLPQPSDFLAVANASVNGFYGFYIKGNNFFPNNKSRLSYKLELYNKALDFWGITSEETAKNPKSEYNRRQIDFQAEYIYKVNRNFYAGVQLRNNYTDAKNVGNIDYLLGEQSQYYVTGLGLSFEFDSRDNHLTPTKGVHLAYRPMAFFKGLGNAPKSFFSHTFIADYYQRLWCGSVLAFDGYMKLNSPATPWTMREMIAADGSRMRGYYMGSCIDNNQIATQIELRQHVFDRFGVAAWAGNSLIFSSFKQLTKQDVKPEWLYNCGIGFRFEFKHNVNLRIDYGFGEGTSGILFAIGEAF